MEKNKLRNLLNALSPDGTSVDFGEFDQSVAKLKESLKGKIEATTLGEMNRQLEKFKKSLDFNVLHTSIENIQTTINGRIKEVSGAMDNEIIILRNSLQNGDSALSSTLSDLRSELDSLKASSVEIAVLRQRLDQMPDFGKQIADAITEIKVAMADDEKEDDAEQERMLATTTESIAKLRQELMNRMNNLPHGGNANRNIAVGGNGSILNKYTDVNFKAGTNVTLTAVANNTTKYTDITIAASGGGGTPSIGGGITGGTDGAVLFVHPASVIAQDANFNYDVSNNQFRVGLTGGPFDVDNRVRAEFVSNINDYGDVAAQNQSTGDSATTDFFASADNDTSTLIGHYTDIGITGSGWNPATAGQIRTVSINAAGSGYSVNDALLISTGGDGNGEVTVTSIGGGGTVTGVLLTNNGTGYVTGNGYSTTGGGGSGCKINVLGILDVTLWGPNDGYVYNSGGNFAISTDTLGKVIKLSVGGTGASNEVARFNSSVLQLGNTGSVAGQINFKGKTAGITNLQVPSTAGAYTFVLPPNAGNANQALTTDGNGVTTWASVVGIGGSGIVRVVSILSVSSTIGASAKTDYVMLPNVGVTLTLPTAIGNSNLYTVKNAVASSTLVATSLGETIDGSASALIVIQNQSLDFISNGSVWAII